jgi:hypothetical protein
MPGAATLGRGEHRRARRFGRGQFDIAYGGSGLMGTIFWFTRRRGGAEEVDNTLRVALSNILAINFNQQDKLLNALLAMHIFSAPPRLPYRQSKGVNQNTITVKS